MFILIVSLLFPSLQDASPAKEPEISRVKIRKEPLPELHQSGSVAFYLHQVEVLLNVEPPTKGTEEATGHLLRYLTLLSEAMHKKQDFLVGSGIEHVLDVEPRNQPVFGKRVTLPPEHKTGNHWEFTQQIISVSPPNLWMYGLTFKGNHTLRIQKVTFFFRDGSQKDWNPPGHHIHEPGVSFKSDQWLPYMSFSEEGHKPVPKRLLNIHILGSAQDGIHSAKLDFLFKIPDPGSYQDQSLLLSLDKLIEKTKSGKDTRESLLKLLLKIRNRRDRE